MKHLQQHERDVGQDPGMEREKEGWAEREKNEGWAERKKGLRVGVLTTCYFVPSKQCEQVRLDWLPSNAVWATGWHELIFK